jgi:Zn-dependent protease
MNANIKLGKIGGIPIGLHFSWFLVFILITWSLGSAYFPQLYPQLSNLTHLFMAVITSLLFFASVLAHELGHSFVAIRNQIPVKSINLFIFGGVAQIEEEPQSAGVEFRIAIAGPLVSLGLSGLFGVLYLLDQQIPLLAAPSLYLMRINLILALFNMIPGFPLDGGRVLRAIVWWKTNNLRRATQIASISGQMVALGFIGIGIFTAISGQFMNGLWLAFIGWFLQNAAASAYAQVNLQEALRGAKVSQAMSRDCTQVSALTPISQLVNDQVLAQGRQCFFVGDLGNPLGYLTLQEITSLPQSKWGFTTAQQIMIPINRQKPVDADAELLSALQRMEKGQLTHVPVLEDNEIVGLISKDQVLRYLRLKSDLGM